MKRKILRFVAAAVTALSLSTGVAAANTGSLEETGPDSRNTVEFKNRHESRVKNNNNLNVANDNPQTTETGNASVRRNTTGGNALTGEAANDSMLKLNVTVNNTDTANQETSNATNGNDDGSILTTGPDSRNEIVFNNKSDVKIENNNYLNVSNKNTQKAESGNASVRRNTTGGDATTGDASNISTTDLTVHITN